MKRLICMAPDGEYITEGLFETTESAWDRSHDMGSRWIFYPLHIVTGPTGKRIVDVPSDMHESWIGKSVKRLQYNVKENQDDVADWLNCKIPCPIYAP